MEPLMPVNVTRDQIAQGDQLLFRRHTDTGKLTELSVISNRKAIPESNGIVTYEALPLDEIVRDKCEGWDEHSNITLYFNEEGLFDHFEKTASATAAGASV
jgi:hypothetical protein